MNNEKYVWVRRQWNNWLKGKVKMESLQDLHWDNMSGGVMSIAPQYFIHGYILCTDIIEGEIAHSCAHGEGPHRIKVCIVKKDNDKEIFDELLKIVGPKPKKGKH